jgi:hypothetical protein
VKTNEEDPCRWWRRRAGDKGQVLPLLCVVIVLGGAVALGLVRLGRQATLRARAQTGADAAALAGAADGEGAARAVAAANGAVLAQYRTEGLDTIVVVEVEGVVARARARRSSPSPRRTRSRAPPRRERVSGSGMGIRTGVLPLRHRARPLHLAGGR